MEPAKLELFVYLLNNLRIKFGEKKIVHTIY